MRPDLKVVETREDGEEGEVVGYVALTRKHTANNTPQPIVDSGEEEKREGKLLEGLVPEVTAAVGTAVGEIQGGWANKNHFGNTPFPSPQNQSLIL
jgi:hypothetical protein